MKHRTWRWLGLGVALLLLADTALWWWAEQALQRGLADWRARLAAAGVPVTVAGEAPGGWPLAASRTLAGLTLEVGGTRLLAAQAVLRLSPLDPGALRIDLPATVSLAGPGGTASSASARAWWLRLPRPGSGPPTMDANDLRIAVGGQRDLTRDLTAALAHVELAATPEGDTALVGSAQSIGLPVPPGTALPLGPRIASVAFDAVLHGTPPAPFLSAPALSAWRDAGGAVGVRRFALGYGPLGVSGQGRFQLDAALQPIGRADLHIVGQAETLDALASGHVISAHVAVAAGAVLSLLAQPPAGGGTPQVDTTLVVRDGVAVVAGFPLLRLPPLAWPAAP